MGLPLVNALKRHAPGLRITWIVEPMPSGVLRPHPSIDEVVVYEKKRGIAGVRELRRALAGRNFDISLNLNVYFKSIWPTLFSGAPERVGFGRDRARDGVWLASNRHLPARQRRHTLDMFLEFAEYLKIGTPAIHFDLSITDEERNAQRAFFAPLADRPTVAIVPASGNARKDWSAERFAEVVDALEGDFGYRTVLVGGPGARETTLARQIVERAGSSPVWALGDGVRRLVWLLDGCGLVIAPDTGPVHIARALDVPVIGLYGHTNPWRVGPYGKFQDLWVDAYTDPGEAPDPSRFDPKQDRMERITASDVLDRVERAARDHPPTPREWSA
jgi:heptosyltransferase I